MRQKSKTEIEIDKTRETILMDAFMKVLNKKEAKNVSESFCKSIYFVSMHIWYLYYQGYSNSEDGGIGEEMVLKLPEANLVTNLLLIDDIILMLHKVKNENFNFITKQVSISIRGKLLKNIQSVIKIFFMKILHNLKPNLKFWII